MSESLPEPLPPVATEIVAEGAPLPTEVILHQHSKILELRYATGEIWRLPFEFLRVFSPSAEVQGHGPGQAVLQYGKREVSITQLEPVGNYALAPHFSDGHQTGLFTWDYLYHLGREQVRLWADYEGRLLAAGRSRD